MTMHNRLSTLLIICLALAGCARGGTQPDADAAGTMAGAEDRDASRQTGLDTGALGAGSEYLEPGMLPGDTALVRDTIVYFDFDTARIRPEFSEMLAAHARRLSGTPSLAVRLEGHADERGSREYNIGLGERRAQAVRQVLMLQGVGAAQITTVSYGEERPADRGSDETAWERNRRVELVYSE
jgi:peptidoglycan-associated lipoprotein